MASLRSGWSRSTVVKLENYNREAVSVGDLLALGIALDVPPVLLLADPRCLPGRTSPETVPVADGLDEDVWTALLWLVGAGYRVADSDLDNLSSANWLIQAGITASNALRALEREEAPFPDDDPEAIAAARARTDERHRAALQQLGTALIRLEARKAQIPQFATEVAQAVLRRARDLGVDHAGLDRLTRPAHGDSESPASGGD
jgi:hypothetical protein